MFFCWIYLLFLATRAANKLDLNIYPWDTVVRYSCADWNPWNKEMQMNKQVNKDVLSKLSLGLQLMIISLSINLSICFFISCLVNKIPENHEKYLPLFPKAQDAISNVVFCPDQQSMTQTYLVYCHRNQKTFTLEKLETENLTFFLQEWLQTINWLWR